MCVFLSWRFSLQVVLFNRRKKSQKEPLIFLYVLLLDPIAGWAARIRSHKTTIIIVAFDLTTLSFFSATSIFVYLYPFSLAAPFPSLFAYSFHVFLTLCFFYSYLYIYLFHSSSTFVFLTGFFLSDTGSSGSLSLRLSSLAFRGKNHFFWYRLLRKKKKTNDFNLLVEPQFRGIRTEFFGDSTKGKSHLEFGGELEG